MRSKLLELTESRENLEKEMRDKVKGEFIDLVVDLVNVNNGLKCQIDQFKYLIYINFYYNSLPFKNFKSIKTNNT